jgi:hypothetical protein
MPRHVPVLFACVVIVAMPCVAFAQVAGRLPDPVARQASAAGGRIQGVVTDDAGRAVGGASIVAMGTTLAAVSTDGRGRFAISLPAGEYVLRATRAGYVSTYREPVRVQSSARLERNITLVRDRAPDARQVLSASLLGSPLPAASATQSVQDDADHAHSELAWRLRHLPRTALRDTSGSRTALGDADGAASFARPASFVDWAFERPARAATSYFANTDFSGQVNFVTTSALGAGGWRPDDWSRGIAYVAFGAPLGTGEWLVRGAIMAGDLSSWALVGEYTARPDRVHAFNFGTSHSTQGFVASGSAPMTVAMNQSRSVGGIFAADRWRVHERVELEYGARLDRYDYVEQQNLLSPRAGVRAAILARTFVTASASQRTVAPGAAEFLPPSSSGPWLPAERTFSSLLPRSPFRAERVREYGFGVEHEFGSPMRTRRIGVRRFWQNTVDQIATLFGLDAASGVGHYYVAVPGDVDFEGWALGISGQLAPRVAGRVDYTNGEATWHDQMAGRLLRRLVPSASRRGSERVHDVSTTVDATIPETATRVMVAYRISSAFVSPDRADRMPITGGRFDVEVRQELPYQPIRGGRLDVLFAVRNLLRQAPNAGGFFDELLTSSPPLRLMGGVQVRF